MPANALGEEPYHIAPMVQSYLNPKFTDKWYDTADEIGNSWFNNGGTTTTTPAKAPVVPSNGVSDTEGTITSTGNKPSLFGNLKNAIGRLNGIKFNNLDNIIPTLTGLGIANRQYNEASGPLRAPQSYASNQYEDAALSKLGQLRQDYYPVWSQNRELEGRGKNAILQSGGLGAGQRALAFMGLANQTQQNNANALFDTQKANNAYKSQWANAALQAGAQTASRKMAARQWDEEMLAKAHAAQLQGKQMAMYNFQNALEQYFVNKFKKHQFDESMKLYRADQEEAKQDRLARVDQANKDREVSINNKPVAVQKAPVTSQQDSKPQVTTTEPAKVTTPQEAAKKVTAPVTGNKHVKRPVSSKKGGNKNTETPQNNTDTPSVQIPNSGFADKVIRGNINNMLQGNIFANKSIKGTVPVTPSSVKKPTNKQKPKSNKQAASNLISKLWLGKREYEKRYGPGSYSN